MTSWNTGIVSPADVVMTILVLTIALIMVSEAVSMGLKKVFR